MVRETSQWEREEMEKVVSEATRQSCSGVVGGAKTREPVSKSVGAKKGLKLVALKIKR